MTATEHVILVDENDHPIGIAEKLAAHRNNQRHRAFSVFIFRQHPELQLLLQQRAPGKYHSANLWTNTCCSHPRPGEDTLQAGERRLTEEMGITSKLQTIGQFHYIAHFTNGLVENEIDHVLLGEYDNKPFTPNTDEIQDHQWISISELEKKLHQSPELFTPWFQQAFEFVKNYFIPVK